MERITTTVAEAQKVRGIGTQILWRPDGKLNPVKPQKDVAIIITAPPHSS